MSEPMRQAWNEVAEGFATLGRMMKERYQSAATGAEEAADAEAAATEAPAEDAALKAAFDRLVAAGRELGDRLGDVARDDEVKAQASRTTEMLDHALSTTVDMITDQLSGLFGRPKDDEGGAGPAGPDGPASPAR